MQTFWHVIGKSEDREWVVHVATSYLVAHCVEYAALKQAERALIYYATALAHKVEPDWDEFWEKENGNCIDEPWWRYWGSESGKLPAYSIKQIEPWL